MEVTHYCRNYEDCPYADQPLGCGTGVYDPYDPTIVAVGPSRYVEWPCRTRLRVCSQLRETGGDANATAPGVEDVGVLHELRCISVVRQDSCPGCGPYLVDLSEAAFEALGFTLEQGVGRVTVERME